MGEIDELFDNDDDTGIVFDGMPESVFRDLEARYQIDPQVVQWTDQTELDFSEFYFGQVLVGLEGKNTHPYCSFDQFCVVVRTNSENKHDNLTVVCPAPVGLKAIQVHHSRFRLATSNEVQRLYSASPLVNHSFANGMLVALTEDHTYCAASGEKFLLPAQSVGVIDNQDFDSTKVIISEKDRTLWYNAHQIMMADNTVISNAMFLNANQQEPTVSVRMQDESCIAEIPISKLQVKNADPKPLIRVVADRSIKARLLTAMTNLDKDIRGKLDTVFSTNGFRDRKGFIGLIYGKHGTGKSSLINAVAAHSGRPIIRFDIRLIMKEAKSVEDALRIYTDLAMRLNAILVIDKVDGFLSRHNHDFFRSNLSDYQERIRLIRKFDGVMIHLATHPIAIDEEIIDRVNLIYEMPDFTPSIRADVWVACLPNKIPIAGRIDFIALSQIELDGHAIKTAIANAAYRAFSEGLDRIPAAYFQSEAERIYKGMNQVEADLTTQRLFREFNGEED